MGDPKQFPNLARVLESHGNEWRSQTRDALVKLRTSFDSDPSVEEWVEQGDLLDQMFGKRRPAGDEAPAEPVTAPDAAAPAAIADEAAPAATADEAASTPEPAGTAPAAVSDGAPTPEPRTEDDTTVPNALYHATPDEAAAQSAAVGDEATVDSGVDDEPAEEEGVPPTLPASALSGAEPVAGTGRSATAVLNPGLGPSPAAAAGGTVVGEPFELPSAFAPPADRPARQPAPPLGGTAVVRRRQREAGGGLGRILGAAAIVAIVVAGGVWGIGQLTSAGDDADELEPVPVKSKRSRKDQQSQPQPAQPPPEPVIPPNPSPVPYEPDPQQPQPAQPQPAPPPPTQPQPAQPSPKPPQPAQPQPTQRQPTQPQPTQPQPTQPQPTQPQPTQPGEPKPWIIPSVLPTLPGG